ncbi:hypothetical protein L400_00067 [Enterobacter hormaechei]|uniref:phage protein NinX family protein n=1 Tax=Enterobacter hormaechei TaxID=158836 RepID=UPI0003BED4D5|nr:phage protein NinX family protein [Enterobacter hormaechei]ESM50674.1 hypothetical protein L400_00067 [Enterobacter hormaechei]MCM7033344.1 DUF2591 domain-containing protein [Enterobacter hormaechei]MCM8203943.1 DUF2591 domain-containing protein [Enterobacter hormaechei]MCM8233677.1 DUF2591 domain-containing protein [Enterobacter hormaechei]MCR6681039.1 DUF2591 domain-containing protein [Enterobacter hormaechei]
MDYSKLSDKEVNRKVQIASRLIGSLTGRGVLIVRDGKWEFFDPCNNPADAWPIITANKISIYAMSEADKRGGWGAEAFHPNDAYSFNDNPLRAAMIVFLMMQESANVPANSAGSDLR